MEVSRAQEIQMIFPEEPDWTSEEDSVLIELVRNYSDEQSCATSALGELLQRDHTDVAELCEFLLDAPGTDRWLKQYALGVLLQSDLQKGVNRSLGFVDHCDTEMLSVIVEELVCQSQALSQELANHHEIIKRVRGRLLCADADGVEWSDEFYQRFGPAR